MTEMADVLAVRDKYRLGEWAEIHKRCKESGLSNRELCRQNGIPEKNFYYWLRKLRKEAIDSQPQLVALENCEAEKGRDEVFHIQFRGARLDLPFETDIGAIAMLLQVMIDLGCVKNYYVACGYTNLHRRIDGLAAIIMAQHEMEIRSDSLFLFCNRRTDRIKALY